MENAEKVAVVVRPDFYADEVLEMLKESHPGTVVVLNTDRNNNPYAPAGGYTIVKLMLENVALLTIREPPWGWPVTVDHHDAQGNEVAYDHCGPDYVPGRHRHGPGHLVEHAAEFARQQTDTPIDSPQKLYDLCEKLLASEQTNAVKAKSGRHHKRAERAKATAPKPS